MWVFWFLLGCIALSLIVHYLKSAPINERSADLRHKGGDNQLQPDPGEPAKAMGHTEADEPSELIRAMKQFSLLTQPRNIQDKPIILKMVYGEESFTVSMVDQTCSCEKFSTLRSRPMNHMGRWCRHLMYVMRTRDALAHENEWIQAIAADEYDGPLFAMIVNRPTTGQILMTGGNSTEWLNFYARTTRKGETITQASGKIKRFGWSTTRKGWAYGKAPPGARELRALIGDCSSINAVRA